MKVDIECDFLTLEEVFEQLKPSIENDFLDDGESLYGKPSFNWGSEEIVLEVVRNTDDVRTDGVRAEYIDTSYIRENCEQYSTYKWVRDVDGTPILLCLD